MSEVSSVFLLCLDKGLAEKVVVTEGEDLVR